MKKFMPAPPQPPPPSPFEWGKRERLEQLLGGSFDLEFEEGTNHFRYESGEQAWNLWVNHYGPAKSLAANLDDARRADFKQDMIAWHETFTSPHFESVAGIGGDEPGETAPCPSHPSLRSPTSLGRINPVRPFVVRRFRPKVPVSAAFRDELEFTLNEVP